MGWSISSSLPETYPAVRKGEWAASGVDVGLLEYLKLVKELGMAYGSKSRSSVLNWRDAEGEVPPER